MSTDMSVYDMTLTVMSKLSKQTYMLSSSEMSKIRWVVSLGMALLRQSWR